MTVEIKPRVLIVDDFHPILFKGLDEMGMEFNYRPEILKDEILELIGNYEGFIVRSKIQCDTTFFEMAKKLKWIARGGSGMDNIDEDIAKEKGIELINAPEGNRSAVAEHTLGLMLNLANNISFSFSEVKNLAWNREANRGIELEGKTLGIIGFGNTGSTVAKKVSGLGMNVIAYDKYLLNINSNFATQVSLSRIFEDSDWISVHVPLTKETHEMINADFLTRFNKSIGLINASRGKVVVSKDVLEALITGNLFAFGADVLENENPSTWNLEIKSVYQKLCTMKNVVITPHIAGWTIESYKKITEVLIQKIREKKCRF